FVNRAASATFPIDADSRCAPGRSRRVTASRSPRALVRSAVIGLLLAGIGGSTPAALGESSITVNFQAAFDGVLKVFATDDNFHHVGGPMIDVAFTQGANVNENVTSSSNDLAKVIERTLAAVDMDSAVIVVDAQSGQYSTPNLGDFLLSALGTGNTVNEPL